VHLPGSCSASSAFPYHRMGRLSASFREHDFSRVSFRGYSYFVMFRPLSLLASQIAPTAASCPAGQPRLLHPSRTCVVTFTCIGHAIRPTTGNWRNEDFHLARFAALSAAHDDLLTILKMALSIARDLVSLFPAIQATRFLTFTSVGLPPTEHISVPLSFLVVPELDTHPTYSPVYASPHTSRCPAQNSGPSGPLVLSRKNFAFSASCRFSPAHCYRDLPQQFWTILVQA
jgi:hypothetical protein